MQFGHFDDSSREYVITTPKTPYPWINYLGTESFFGLISHQAGGYCFYQTRGSGASFGTATTTRPPTSAAGTSTSTTGATIGRPATCPSNASSRSTSVGTGSDTPRSPVTRGSIRAEVLYFVPLGHTAEVHRVKLKNEGSAKKTIKLFSYVEFCLWNAHDDSTNYQRNFSTGEVEVVGSTIYHKTEYRERRNHFAFYHVNQKVSGFDTDRETFFGLYNGMGEPDVVAQGASKNSVASGWSPIASHGLEVTLAPGEEKSFVFTLGYVENPQSEKWERPGIINKTRAKALIDAFSTDAQVDAALAKLAQHWAGMLSKYTLKSGDEKLDRMVNIWNPYQCMVTFNMSRSASYFEIGHRPRHGISRLEPRPLGLRAPRPRAGPRAHHRHRLDPIQRRERLSSVPAADQAREQRHRFGFQRRPVVAHSRRRGVHQRDGRLRHSSREVPFDNDPNEAATLFEHLKRSFYHVVENLGPHGLPLIGRADWNDCLNLNCSRRPPTSRTRRPATSRGAPQNRSSSQGCSFTLGPNSWRSPRSSALKAKRRRQSSTSLRWSPWCEKHGYDGEWFLRAYDYYGNKVGSKENKEGQIFIEPQGFCVMAGIGVENGLAKKALDSVKERLDTPYGIVLVNPAYSEYHIELGEISSYPPGYKENAGIFCHNNPWIMIAETVLRRGDRAFDYYKKITPAYLEDKSEIHRTEPYVYSQMIAGKDAVRHGEAKNSWLTGTAAWNFVAIAHYMLGVRAEYDGLLIDPCIGKEIADFTISRTCRGTEFRIHVKNSGSGKKAKLKVGGKELSGNIVPYAAAGAIVEVECEV